MLNSVCMESVKSFKDITCIPPIHHLSGGMLDP